MWCALKVWSQILVGYINRWLIAYSLIFLFSLLEKEQNLTPEEFKLLGASVWISDPVPYRLQKSRGMGEERVDTQWLVWAEIGCLWSVVLYILRKNFKERFFRLEGEGVRWGPHLWLLQGLYAEAGASVLGSWCGTLLAPRHRAPQRTGLPFVEVDLRKDHLEGREINLKSTQACPRRNRLKRVLKFLVHIKWYSLSLKKVYC